MEIDDGMIDVADIQNQVNQQQQHNGAMMMMNDDGDEGKTDIDNDKPTFNALTAHEMAGGQSESRKITVPQHRYTPLKANWMKIYTPIVEHLKLQIRMNLKTRSIEIKTSDFTEDSGSLQKATDFVKAFMLGFEADDAMALLRLDDLYVDTFEVTDVRLLKGDHLSRAVGRVAGKGGKTKFTIENTTKTRIVVADTKIHILGSYQNIRVARDALVALIAGSPPGKVYGHLRSVASRMNSQF